MKRLLLLISCLACVSAAAQDRLPDSLRRLLGYAYAASSFGKALPQEKVHLHLDNTSYYRADRIWFGCYVVEAGTNRPTALSRTLYVELLNPGGTVIEKKVLPIVGGRCNGNFALTHLPFYSGFYEIRAYTKYMLNFGEETVCSRTIPVFDEPEDPANTADKRMMRPRTASGKYPSKRTFAKRGGSVNVRFFPEGGNLVEGLPSRVAFEATDADGLPLAASGTVRDRQGNVKAEFATEYGGRGAFDYTPAEGDRAEIMAADGRSRRVELPEMLPQGIVMRVDNLSSADSIAVEVRKSAGMPATMLGAAVICGGALSSYSILDLADGQPIDFKIDKRRMPAGVARIILVGLDGMPIADRLLFTHAGRRAAIEVAADKPQYEPYDSIRLDFSLRDADGRPLAAPISVSVRDGENETAYYGDMLTDLLLCSEIKGYVHRPSYYFESDDSLHRTALDRLLMVQGWRRYDWAERAGTRPFDLEYLPEQGVEVHGRVLRYGTDKPLTDIRLSSVLLKRGEEGGDGLQDNMAHAGTVEVDSTGRFTFVGNLWGKWALNLSVTNDKNRRKASRILLDRLFSPAPREYLPAEMNIETADAPDEHRPSESEAVRTIVDTTALYYDDGETDMTKKVHRIKEIVVKGEKRSREDEIYRSRSTSTSFYDIPAEMDAIRDAGESVTDIHELLASLSDKFVISRQSVNTLNTMSRSKDSTDIDVIEINGQWRITYKGKAPLFVVDYEKVRGDVPLYDLIRLSAIKAIYINEDLGVITQYADITKMSPMEISSHYSCVVFIETYPEGRIPVEAGRGVRKTWIDGYAEPDEFYMPDYSVMPKENDYRRTLYWNPELKPDEQGRASVKFYNNSRCRRMKISAETLADDGAIGVLSR